MDTSPFIIDSNSSGDRLTPIDPGEATYPESWLQELLRLHPSILPVAEIEPVFYPLIPIGQEVAVASGYIDNLFISPQGYPVLVETKLWRNPEAKRDVLAQIIDYASSLSGWTIEKLDQATRHYTRQFEGKAVGLVDWVSSRYELDVDRHFFEDTVSRNLRLGRMLVLVVGDRIRSGVVDMLAYVNRYPHLAMNVVLIELRCYRMTSGRDWPLLVVPSILSKTEIIERSIVQVNVTVDGSYQVHVNQEQSKGKPATNRASLTEDEYWARLQQQNPEAVEPARRLIDYYREREGIIIRPRDNSIAVHLCLPETGQRISLFFIRTDGIIESWHAAIVDQLEKVGLPPGILQDYVQELGACLKNRTKTLSIYYQASKVDPENMIIAVDHFIDRLVQAEPKAT